MWYLGALAVALGLSFLPVRRLGWVTDLSGIVTAPTVPFGDVTRRVVVWLKPAPNRGESPETAALQQEIDRFRTLYHAERERVEELRQRIEQLERTREIDPGVAFDALTATITGRNTQSAGEVYVLNRGSGRRAQRGAVVVYNGSHLMGRIESVTTLTSLMIPITNPAIGPIEGFAAPAAGADARNVSGERPRTFLTPQKDGTLRGDIARDAGVREGDLILLADPSWPRTAWARIVGTVVSVRPRDDSPFRDALVVRPRFTAANLASVTILIESGESGIVGGNVGGAG